MRFFMFLLHCLGRIAPRKAPPAPACSVFLVPHAASKILAWDASSEPGMFVRSGA